MADYEVTLAGSAVKELERLPATVPSRVFPHIEALGHEPRPHGSKKLRGPLALWRIRVGDYRVIYSIDAIKRIVDVSAVRHRSKAYE